MNIVCIGSGNVATHLAIAFKAIGADIVQVWSQDSRNAEILAALTKAAPISNWDDLDRSADCYVIAVKDSAIASIAAHLTDVKGVVVHTSGATPMSVLSAVKSGYGVLYPMQTFSKSKAVDMTRVPICIEADREDTLEKIKIIAQLLSSKVSVVSSQQRGILHVAAVFASNFTNHLYQLSSELLEQHQLNFDLLKPLILETAEKVQSSAPAEAQTGPAIRNDQETIKRHLDLLSGAPGLQKIYQTLSNSIKKTDL